MPAIKIFPFTDDIIRRYQAGESVKELCREFGVTESWLFAERRRRGIIVSDKVGVFSNIIDTYQSGVSELATARQFGVSRAKVRYQLLKAGIIPRNGSEANKLSLSRMTPLERSARTNAAHVAVRGRKVSVAEKELHAIACQNNLTEVSPLETILVDMLRAKGFTIVQQKAIGIYNVDIAIESCRVAVEVNGGNWHTSPAHFRRDIKRIPYLFDRGWHLIIIWVDKVKHPLAVESADYITTFVQLLGRYEPVARQYRMIWGDGKAVTFPSMNLINNTVVPSSAHSFEP